MNENHWFVPNELISQSLIFPFLAPEACQCCESVNSRATDL
jgi:hypothetical protein